MSSTISQIDAVDDISTAPAVNNFVAELFTNGGNNALYNGITKLHVHGETVLLGEELHLQRFMRTGPTFPASLWQIPDV